MSVAGKSVGDASPVRAYQPVSLVDSTGFAIGSASAPIATSSSSPALTGGTNRSGTATTTSGGLSVAANASRKFLVGQNLGTVNIGFNEFGGTAAIGTAGTYTVPAGSSFSISTSNLVNFIAASGTVAVTMTEG